LRSDDDRLEPLRVVARLEASTTLTDLDGLLPGQTSGVRGSALAWGDCAARGSACSPGPGSIPRGAGPPNTAGGPSGAAGRTRPVAARTVARGRPGGEEEQMSPAQASVNDSSTDDIKKRGGKCVLVATNSWECTDKDGTVWWCDATSCQP